MTNKKKNDREQLALDALLAACCKSGELDAEMTEGEAEAFAASVPGISTEDQAAIGANVVEDARKHVDVQLELAEPLRDLGPVSEPAYAAQTAREGTAAEDLLAKGRKRLRKFLGETR